VALAPLNETPARARGTTAGASLTGLVTIVHNSTLVLVGMILIVSSMFVLLRMVPILSSIFVLQYTCIVVSLYYSKYVLLVRLYYSIFVLLRMILITSSTHVLEYACTIENDSHYQ
jgi:hypothetical protein